MPISDNAPENKKVEFNAVFIFFIKFKYIIVDLNDSSVLRTRKRDPTLQVDVVLCNFLILLELMPVACLKALNKLKQKEDMIELLIKLL